MIAFSTGTASREEADAAGAILGVEFVSVHGYQTRRFIDQRQEILDRLIRERELFKPEVVFCPSSFDRHQDHEVIRAETWRAFRSHASILGYELPWSCQSFDAQMLVPVDRPAIAKKATAMLKYKSQRGRSYTGAAAILALARVRGVQAGVEYAEAFEVIRWIDSGKLEGIAT
jgi:LmbE family N-acetylglucosaminyl deacetylase